MQTLEGWSRPMRKIAREYGYAIVRDMIAEGYNDPLELFDILSTRRDRMQEQWLATNFITERKRDVVAAAVARSRAVAARAQATIAAGPDAPGPVPSISQTVTGPER